MMTASPSVVPSAASRGLIEKSEEGAARGGLDFDVREFLPGVVVGNAQRELLDHAPLEADVARGIGALGERDRLIEGFVARTAQAHEKLHAWRQRSREAQAQLVARHDDASRRRPDAAREVREDFI